MRKRLLRYQAQKRNSIKWKKRQKERKSFESTKHCVRVCLKGQPDVVIYELRANSISNWVLHFVTSDKRAGHTLSPLNELNLLHKNTCPRSLTFTYLYSTQNHSYTSTQTNAQKVQTQALSSTHKHTFTHTSHSLPRTLLPPEPPSTDRRSPRLLSDTSPRVKGQLTSVKSRGVLRAPWCGWGHQTWECSHIPFGSLWSKGPGGLKGGTLLKNTCDNDVIWVLARPARQLLTVMM